MKENTSSAHSATYIYSYITTVHSMQSIYIRIYCIPCEAYTPIYIYTWNTNMTGVDVGFKEGVYTRAALHLTPILVAYMQLVWCWPGWLASTRLTQQIDEANLTPMMLTCFLLRPATEWWGHPLNGEASHWTVRPATKWWGQPLNGEASHWRVRQATEPWG